MPFDLPAVQQALRDRGLDCWLLYDFRGLNPLARNVLSIPAGAHTSRRWAYAIPAQGQPKKLNQQIEPEVLAHLPGERKLYRTWQQFEEGLGWLTEGQRVVAMEYSPFGGNPYVSRVDAGTIELVRRLGKEVVSSGDLIQLFEALLTDEQRDSHFQADRVTQAAFEVAWDAIVSGVSERGGIRESEVQRAILDHFKAHGCVTDHSPIVGEGPNSGDPHYDPKPGFDREIREGSLVLVDLWCKLDREGAVYSDLTKMGYVGSEVPEKYATVFGIVAAARDAAIELVRDRFARGETLKGWEVDDAARNVIAAAGYGDAFRHRTGHSIGANTHGNGAHMDHLETVEDRTVMPGALFSIEPGIYLPEFGIRSEINVFVDRNSQVHVTGGVQREILALGPDE